MPMPPTKTPLKAKAANSEFPIPIFPDTAISICRQKRILFRIRSR